MELTVILLAIALSQPSIPVEHEFVQTLNQCALGHEVTSFSKYKDPYKSALAFCTQLNSFS